MPAAPAVNRITPTCVGPDGLPYPQHRYRFGTCIRCGYPWYARQKPTCDHADRYGWKCLTCGFDAWPARRVELLREYGVTT